MIDEGRDNWLNLCLVQQGEVRTQVTFLLLEKVFSQMGRPAIHMALLSEDLLC